MEYPIRLNAYLRDIGVASRREADQLIAGKKVKINGVIATLGTLVHEGDDVVIKAHASAPHRYMLYYKPRGLPTQGAFGVKSVISEWRPKGLFPVGRLDKESEGLLILTNDGRVTTKILGSENRVEKEYEVVTNEKIRSGIPAILKKGMHSNTLGDLLPAHAVIKNDSTIRITLREGKRHQIRVMLAELGLTVKSLKRIRIGSLTIGGMRPGTARVLGALPDDLAL